VKATKNTVVRVELTRSDLIDAAGSVPKVLTRKRANGATRVELELKLPQDVAPVKEDTVIAVVTFVFDANEPVT
jgi:hypothetical protein